MIKVTCVDERAILHNTARPYYGYPLYRPPKPEEKETNTRGNERSSGEKRKEKKVLCCLADAERR